MDKTILNKFTNATNRSMNQTLFLLDLVEGNLLKLVELEEKIKNNFISFAPASKEKVDEILSMSYGKYWFKIKFISTETKTELQKINYEDWSDIEFANEYSKNIK